MRYFLIIQFIISFVFGTRVFDSHGQYTLDNNRSCGQRPVLDYAITSPSGHFVIHFDNYYTGIEEYANNVSIAADLSREIIVDMMNFRPEIADDDGLYDIYIKELPNGAYGWNCLEGDLGASWVEIDDNYIGSNYSTTGEDAMKISIAHEFFHAIQRAYAPIPGSNSFFYELSSMWIEDIVYPEINDYIFFSQYGDDYFSDPEQNMNSYNGYGLGLYGHYLNFKFGNQIMQRIWEAYAFTDLNDEDVFNAINEVLMNEEYDYDSSFIDTWIDFNTRNLFNGYFENLDNNVYYYEDQTQFNAIQTDVYDINQYLMPSDYDSYTEYFEYSISSNNKSVKIKSFNINNDNQEFLIFIDGDNAYSSLGLFSDYQTGIYDLDISNSYILNNNDMVHFLYASDNDNDNIITTIYTRNVGCMDPFACNYNHEATYDDGSCEYPFICWDNSFSCELSDCPDGYDIKLGPNPINLGENLNVILSGSIEVNNLKFEIIDIKGKLINSMSLGSINYNHNNLNIISFNPFHTGVASGLYILKLDLDGKVFNKKIIYLK